MAGELLWSTQSGFLTNNKLNKTIQRVAQPLFRFRQYVTIKEAFGKQVGESVNWLKVANVGTYGGSLVETNTMHETTQTLTWGTLSVTEYGNSIPFTFKIESLSQFDIQDIVRRGLMDDMVKVIDGVVERQFNNTVLRYVGTSTTGGAVTTNGTATATNTSVLNAYHVRKMVTQLKTRNVPGFKSLGGDYVFIVSVEAAENVRAALESVYQYVDRGNQLIMDGEIGRYYGVRFVEDSFASRFTYSATARTATAKSWSGGQSLDGYLFGEDTVREAIVVPEEIRMKVTTDYGRSKGIGWYNLGGWQLEWSDEPNARIIKWDSAA
jgi:N4-gp56 family major capsid protein